MSGPRVSLLTLGCARNEVDSSEIAGRLTAGGYTLLDERDQQAPDVIVVNTCAFVEAAKKDSIDAVLAAADTGAKVVAVGCLAQRYGAELAEALPEADAVLGFDAYPDLPGLLGDVLARTPPCRAYPGRPPHPAAHRPRRPARPRPPLWWCRATARQGRRHRSIRESPRASPAVRSCAGCSAPGRWRR